jgi:hypothetical protein
MCWKAASGKSRVLPRCRSELTWTQTVRRLAVTSISTRARSSISALTSIADIATA